jgi:ABC-2 type transport system permease protein
LSDMKAIWPNVQKEFLLMRRDIAGLLVIFLMPVALVIIVTLVQQNVLAAFGGAKMKGLFVDQDRQTVGAKILKNLRESKAMQLTDTSDGGPSAADAARKAVAHGNYQFAIIVPQGTTKVFVARAREAAEKSIVINKTRTTSPGEQGAEAPNLLVCFDPAISENARTGIMGILKGTLALVETDEKMKAFSELLPKKVETAAKASMGSQWSDDFKGSLPDVRITWDPSPVMALRGETARYGKVGKAPSTVQQNVPAWTLFGIFFIVVPLGGSLLRERQADMLVRLLTMPQSCFSILAAKIIAYLVICLMQFLLILAIGTFLLPKLGAPALEMGSSPGAILLIVVAASLAACGYGILLGTMAGTYDQASSFGAVSIVIGAALGGIMVPVHAMPEVMQRLSILSPLSWGLNAFLDVFVREGDVRSVAADVLRLLSFFLVMSLAAWFFLAKRGRIRTQ